MLKTFTAIAAFAGAAVAVSQTDEPQSIETQASPAQQKIVVHLSHFTDDLHRTIMALKTANWMQKGGAQVTLFLDVEGVRLAERRQRLDLQWGEDSPTLAELYEAFIDAGGRVLLCPHCAHSARIEDPALKRWAALGTEESLTELFLSADKVIDY